MKFIKITDTSAVVKYLTETLLEHLSRKERVLWLVPGGSSIAIAAAVSQNLKGKDLSNLVVTLTDERFGPLNHADSNWLQLQEAGFELPGAMLEPVLNGHDRAETTQRFSEVLEKALQSADYRLGFFGMGADGHTAGILPDSPAVSESRFAASYDASNFQRVTMTPAAICKLDEVVVYAVGIEKWPVLDELETDKPINQQPVHILKSVQKVTFYNDHKGEVS